MVYDVLPGLEVHCNPFISMVLSRFAKHADRWREMCAMDFRAFAPC